MVRDQLGHPVVREARQLRGHVRAGERLDRRRREREDLDVTLVPVHDPEALLEVDQDGDPTHALLHVEASPGDLEHPVEEPPREDVREDVDLHRASGAVAGVGSAARSTSTNARPAASPITSGTSSGRPWMGGRIRNMPARQGQARLAQPRGRNR